MKLAGVISLKEIQFGPIIFRGRFDESIAKLAQLGYEGVEISLRDPHNVDIESMHGILKKHRISLASIATGPSALMEGLSFTDINRNVRDAAIARIMRHIDLASQFSAQVIIGGMKGNLPEGKQANEARKWAVEAFQKVAEYAESKSTIILMETINRYEMNWLNTVSEGIEFIRQINRDNVALHVDTFHMNIEEPSPSESILQAGSQIGYVHLADSNRWAPGYGHIDFSETIDCLRKIGYSGYLSFEVLPLPDPDSAAAMGLKTIHRLLT